MAAVVDDYLSALGSRLRGPARSRTEMLTEVRNSLDDAVEAYVAEGLDLETAQRRAVAEFGEPAQLLPAYQAELTADALHRLSLRVIVVGSVLVAFGDLTWRGASWSGSAPPVGYQWLTVGLTACWIGNLLLALVSYLVVGWRARRGSGSPVPLRVCGWALSSTLALGAVKGVAVYVWSVELWQAALTWPPMIVGGLVCAGAWFWLGRTAGVFLTAARGPVPAR